MSKFLCQTSVNTSLITIGLVTGIFAQGVISTSALAAFPDTQNHWANPFIQTLTERNIISGYPDGTFRPNQEIQRDELAAIIRKAFEKERTRQITSGSVYKDVPDNYWAEEAIKQAYEMGFMSGTSQGLFRPNQSVSRVDVLTSLMQAVDVPTKAQATSTNQTATNQTNRQRKRPRLFIPMFIGSLMQPIIAQRPVVATTGTTNQATTSATPQSLNLNNYYTDANNIPKNAVDGLRKATQANVVVNHPNPRVLNPNQPATRADVTAFVHQALVSQGRLQPLPSNVQASKYIVDINSSTN
ncbi:MAG: S-layer homology domain-containing protein [Methylacidiphilales bacterium]|nr:S-layer homology domain-containing protein [Candidatus Methylacidiphilales bacterium]NJR16687.1 S-layer homology domain-containing protein [Calothrix sp. CSU_2_0]